MYQTYHEALIICLIVTLSLHISEAYKENVIKPLTKSVSTCYPDGVRSDPKNCSTYYLCKDGYSYHLSCGKKFFNSETNKCSDVSASNCDASVPHQKYRFLSSRPKRATQQYPTVVCYVSNWKYEHGGDDKLRPDQIHCGRNCYSTVDLKIGDISSELGEIICQSDGLYSDSEDCGQYWFCKDGLKYHLSCSHNAFFDPVNGKCANIPQENCKPGQTVYFPYSFKDIHNMIQDAERSRGIKLTCYLSNWNTCKKKDTGFGQVLCDQVCTTFEKLNTNYFHTAHRAVSPCAKREYKVICYFTTWGWHKKGKGKFLVEHVDPSLCTHIMYSPATVDEKTLTIKEFDAYLDIEQGFYRKILALKSTGVKVLIHLGGWPDSKSTKFSRLVNSPTNRKKFIDNLMVYMEKWGFDGMEFDWQYAKCWQNNCNAGPESDKENFIIMMQELSEVFWPKGLLLSVPLSRYQYITEAGYDVAEMSKYVDWFIVHSQHYHTSEQGKTGHVAPLYKYTDDELNVNSTIQYLIRKGATPGKLLMAIPTFTNALTLADPKNHGMEALTTGPGKVGEYSNTLDIYGFFEVCEYVKKNGWKSERDPQKRYGSYAYKDDQWASYNDVLDVKVKADYIKQYGLGGAHVWTLNFDDFSNVCGCGRFPILSTISHELRGTPTNITENCT